MASRVVTETLDLESRYAQRMSRVTASAIMELLKLTGKGDYISFASGLPDPALYPVETLRELSDRVLREDGRAALQYGPAEGHPPLREWVAERLRTRGLRAEPENVLITSGSQQALDLAARLFLDPGDRVLLENPSYLAAVQIFDSLEATYEAVPIDAEGMRTEVAAERLVRGGIRLVFTLPNFQNPTGATMPRERREELARTCARAGVPVLEDDAYHDLRYEGEALPPVTGLAKNPLAIYTGTFSKTIAPGLRVGYLCAAAPVVERLAQLKQLTDLQSNSFTQRIALQYCLDGHLEPQIERLRDTYRARRDTLLAALEAELSGFCSWTRPQGGMFLFLTLPRGLNAAELLPRVLERGVVYVPGESFHPAGGGQNTLRLNFVSATEERIREGVRLLAGVIREAAA